MDAPLVLHRHYGGSIDHTGAPPWHPRFEAYIGSAVPARIVRERARKIYWWQQPGVYDWISAQPTRFAREALSIVSEWKQGANIDDLTSFHSVSKSWIQRQAFLLETAVIGELFAGHID